MILALSFVRYIIFIHQFYFLLLLFGVDIPILQAFLGISLIYLVMNVLPIITIAEIGIRGSVAIVILGYFTQNELGIVAATSILWILNLAFPVALGAILFWRIKM